MMQRVARIIILQSRWQSRCPIFFGIPRNYLVYPVGRIAHLVPGFLLPPQCIISTSRKARWQPPMTVRHLVAQPCELQALELLKPTPQPPLLLSFLLSPATTTAQPHSISIDHTPQLHLQTPHLNKHQNAQRYRTSSLPCTVLPQSSAADTTTYM